MTEIKFRAWDEGNKIMHNNFQWIKSGEEGNDWLIFTSDKHTLDHTPNPFNDPHFQQQFIILPYSGKKDKNSIEIYAGDICRYYSKNIPSGVWQSRVSEVVLPDFLFKYNDYYYKDFEIIGNKFLNPELLLKKG